MTPSHQGTGVGPDVVAAENHAAMRGLFEWEDVRSASGAARPRDPDPRQQ